MALSENLQLGLLNLQQARGVEAALQVEARRPASRYIRQAGAQKRSELERPARASEEAGGAGNARDGPQRKAAVG